jgi:hypothetical protein
LSNWVKVIDVDSFVFSFKSWPPSSDVIPTAIGPILRSAPLVGDSERAFLTLSRTFAARTRLYRLYRLGLIRWSALSLPM